MPHKITTLDECAWAYRYILDKLLKKEWTEDRAHTQMLLVDEITKEIKFKNFLETL